jgi:hypothetical protein
MKNNPVYHLLSGIRDCLQWHKRSYAAPSPHFIKQACLLRNGFPAATWVETGTFLGQTTQLLSKHADRVYSIEPEPKLFARAQKLFSDLKHVEILNGASEDVFPELLPRITGDVNFWLDGHYSAGITFKGRQDTPILDELACISRHIDKFGKVCVLVDDIRCFNPRTPEYSTYPSLDTLVSWASTHELGWHIEHDIFVAKTV